MTQSSSSEDCSTETETELPLSQDEDVSFLGQQLTAEDRKAIEDITTYGLGVGDEQVVALNWSDWYFQSPDPTMPGAAPLQGSEQVAGVLSPPPTPQDQRLVPPPGGHQPQPYQLQQPSSKPFYMAPRSSSVSARSRGDQLVATTASTSIPALDSWAGTLQFKVDVRLPKLSGRMLQAAFDPEARKLYVDCFMSVPFGFRVKKGADTGELRLRALPVYSEMHHMNTPVRRCPSHREASHETNIDATDHIEWVVRADNCNAKYEASGADGERRSVVVPFEPPQPGTGEFVVFYKFCCMNSCIGGINRRRLRVLFTLENIVTGETVGRDSVELKVCKCPLRDFRTDMQRRSRSTLQPRPSKRYRESSPGRERPGAFMLDCGSQAVYNYMKTMLDALRRSVPDMAAQLNRHHAGSSLPISSEECPPSVETPAARQPPPSMDDVKPEYL